MSDRTSISWTDSTWNPIRGTLGKWTCQRISPGCKNCYAATMNRRFGGPDYTAGADEPRLDAKALAVPLHWQRPRTIFVGSMTDLFWDRIPFEWIAAVFGVMAACPQHRFLVLTKRAERMREWFEWVASLRFAKSKDAPPEEWTVNPAGAVMRMASATLSEAGHRPLIESMLGLDSNVSWPWPLPNVAIGISAEYQQRLDERVPDLLATPAALRFVSAEPLLSGIQLDVLNTGDFESLNSLTGERSYAGRGGSGGRTMQAFTRGLDLVIVGGESGPRARPCDVAWIRSIRDQCREAGVSVHVKQLGAQASVNVNGFWGTIGLRDRKGADLSEWAEDLRVRDPWPWPVSLDSASTAANETV